MKQKIYYAKLMKMENGERIREFQERIEDNERKRKHSA